MGICAAKKIKTHTNYLKSQVGDLSWSSGAMLGDARSPGVIGDSRSPSKVMVGDINLVSNLSPEIPLTLFKPKHPLGQVGFAPHGRVQV